MQSVSVAGPRMFAIAPQSLQLLISSISTHEHSATSAQIYSKGQLSRTLCTEISSVFPFYVKESWLGSTTRLFLVIKATGLTSGHCKEVEYEARISEEPTTK